MSPSNADYREICDYVPLGRSELWCGAASMVTVATRGCRFRVAVPAGCSLSVYVTERRAYWKIPGASATDWRIRRVTLPETFREGEAWLEWRTWPLVSADDRRSVLEEVAAPLADVELHPGGALVGADGMNEGPALDGGQLLGAGGGDGDTSEQGEENDHGNLLGDWRQPTPCPDHPRPEGAGE